jgi:hypothetical protein
MQATWRQENDDKDFRAEAAKRVGYRPGNHWRSDALVRPTRSVAEDVTEWLFARSLPAQRHFDAGSGCERAQLAPSVTMAWSAAPAALGRGGSAASWISMAQIGAKRCFDNAIATAGRDLPILSARARG